MKRILFAIILSNLSHCTVNDVTDNNTSSNHLNWIQLPEFIDELDCFGEVDLMAPPAPAPKIPSHDQYSIQQCGPTSHIHGSVCSAGVTGSLYPNYESAEMKPSSVVTTNIVAISSTSILTSSMLLFGDNPQNHLEMSNDNQVPITIDHSAATICQASAKNGNSQALPSESTLRQKNAGMHYTYQPTGFGGVASFELPSAQSKGYLASSAYVPPAPVQPVSIQPQNQDNSWNSYNPYQQSLEVPASTKYLTGDVTGMQYTYQPTVSSAAQTCTTASNINHMTASSGLSSKALLAVDNSQTLAIRLTEQSAVTSSQLHPKTSNINVPSNQVSVTNSVGAPRALTQVNGYKAILRLPLRQLIKVLNAVSSSMGREKIRLGSTVKIILQTTLERVQELLEQLCLLDDSAFYPIPVIPGGAIIDKASVQASLERITTQTLKLNGAKNDIRKLLNVMTGQDYRSMEQSECYKKVAEVLVSHAMLLYGPIPDVTFDNKGKLTVDGDQFPEVEEIKEYYQERLKNHYAKFDKKDSPVTSTANTSISTVNNAHSESRARTSISSAPNSHSTQQNRSATSATPGTSSYSLLFGDSAQPLEPRSSKDAPKSTFSTSSTSLLFGNHSSTSSNITTGPHFNSLFETGIPHGALIPTISIESWVSSATAAFTAPSMAQIRPLEVAQQYQVPIMTSPQMANPVYATQPSPVMSTQVSTSSTTSSNQDVTIDQAASVTTKEKNISRTLPISLFVKTLNEVSKLMGKETRSVKSSRANILKAAHERFQEVFEMLDQLDESKLGFQFGNMLINKETVKAASNRTKSQKPEFFGLKSNSQKFLSIVTGCSCDTLSLAECYELLTIILARHAMILYNEIPGVIFDKDGKFSFKGICFPDPDTVRAFFQQTNEKSRKRKRGETVEKPNVRKRQKNNSRACTSVRARHRRNLELLVDMHNSFAARFNTEQIEIHQSVVSFAPHLAKSIIGLIDRALERRGEFLKAEIHEQYPVTEEFLRSVKKFLTEVPMPKKKRTNWFLNAFNVPNFRSIPFVDKMCVLANWYATVAFASTRSIDNLRYENGKVFLGDQYFLPHLKTTINNSIND